MISDRMGQPRQREMIGQEDELRPQISKRQHNQQER